MSITVVLTVMNNTINFYRYRSDSRGFVQQLLSEESRRKRKRSNAINIQITFITWLLEFSAGILCAVVYFTSSMVASRWLAFLDMTLNFILVPGSYIINNDVNKAAIMAHGWIQGIRRMISLTNPDEPNQDNGNVANNENQARESLPLANPRSGASGVLKTEGPSSSEEPTCSKAANFVDGEEDASVSEQPSTSNGATSSRANVERSADSCHQNETNQFDNLDRISQHRSENGANDELEDVEEGIVTIEINPSKVEYKAEKSKIKNQLHTMKNNWVENS